MKTKEISILYVDDEAENLKSFKASFRREFNVLLANNAKEGKAILHKNEVDIILTDQRMPEMTGIEFLVDILDEFPDPIRMLVTGYSDIDAVIDAINKGQVYKYISKPWNKDELKDAIHKAYEVYSLRKENKKLLKDLKRVNSQLEFMLRQKLIS